MRREVFRRKLWAPDTFVDFDHGLNKSVQKLRDALGDSAESPRFVETIPRVGYRFIAPVTRAVRRGIEELDERTGNPFAAAPTSDPPRSYPKQNYAPSPLGYGWLDVWLRY